jgi:hypothetical protein
MLSRGRSNFSLIEELITAAFLTHLQIFLISRQDIIMASGIEIAGLTLAVLPLLVKRLDDYATGLTILKSFRTRIYRREMDAYRASLGTQSANLRNAIITLIEDVLEGDIETPTANLLAKGEWLSPLKRGRIDQRLRQSLDMDYDIFVANLQSLSFMLIDLRRKLDLDGESQEQVGNLSESPMLWWSGGQENAP